MFKYYISKRGFTILGESYFLGLIDCANIRKVSAIHNIFSHLFKDKGVILTFSFRDTTPMERSIFSQKHAASLRINNKALYIECVP